MAQEVRLTGWEEERLCRMVAAVQVAWGRRFLSELGDEAIREARAEGHNGLLETDKMYERRLVEAGLAALSGAPLKEPRS